MTHVISKKNHLLMCLMLEEYLEQMMFKIENAVWQRVVRALYRKYDKEFFTYPAAKTDRRAAEI